MTILVLHQAAPPTFCSKIAPVLQLDASTDLSNCAYLLVYCRYTHAVELKDRVLDVQKSRDD